MSDDQPMRHVFLIDGSGFIFRAFYAMPMMARPDGTPVNAVYGFTTMVLKLIENTDADHIAVVFDADRRTFRNDIYPGYKAQRPPTPEALVPQFALMRQATKAFNLASVEMGGFEADDIIATYARLAREAGARVTIVSSDKDLMQLVGDGVMLFDAMKNRDIGPDQVRAKFGVGPERVIDVQALAGDASDNVPGVPGIGVKTAAQLIEEYGDLDALLARAAEIKQPKRRDALIKHAKMARLSRRLVTLRADVPVTAPLESFAKMAPEPEAAVAFLKTMGFNSLLSRFGATDLTGNVSSGRSERVRIGYFQIRKVKGGPLCAARIWRPCRCTVNGGADQLEHPWRPTCDRFPQMQGLIDGVEADPLAIWLHGEAIDAARYNYLLSARPYTGSATKKIAPDKIDPKRFAP